MRILYRARQFWRTLTLSTLWPLSGLILVIPSPEDMAHARQVLSPPLVELFLNLQPSEQVHSFRILHQLRDQGEPCQDLLAAALLHDVGKSRHPLHLWERMVIVLGKQLFPERVKHWGQGDPRGWKRPFVVAEQHAAWGAEMAAHAGVATEVAMLIRRHHEPVRVPLTHKEDQLLYRLQRLDDES